MLYRILDGIRGVRIVNRVMLWMILALILPLIVIIVLRVKRPDLAHIKTASTVVGRLAQTYFLIIAIEPAFLLIFSYIKSRNGPKDSFGKGSWNSKFIVLGISTVFAIIEAGFRCGTTWTPAPLASDPAWWDHKAAFYCFNFVIDILILTTLLVGRIDRRFYVPDKAEGGGVVLESDQSRCSRSGKVGRQSCFRMYMSVSCGLFRRLVQGDRWTRFQHNVHRQKHRIPSRYSYISDSTTTILVKAICTNIHYH